MTISDNNADQPQLQIGHVDFMIDAIVDGGFVETDRKSRLASRVRGHSRRCARTPSKPAPVTVP